MAKIKSLKGCGKSNYGCLSKEKLDKALKLQLREYFINMRAQLSLRPKLAGGVASRQKVCVLILVLLLADCFLSQAQPMPDYDKTVAQARHLMDTGKLAEAYLAASAAITIDDKHWESYAGVMPDKVGMCVLNTVDGLAAVGAGLPVFAVTMLSLYPLEHHC